MPSTNKRARQIPWINKRRHNKNSYKTNNDIVDEDEGFYQSVKWRKLRNYFINLNPLCKYCLYEEDVYVVAKHVDHIVGIKIGGAKLSLDNLQSLCVHHHQKKSAYEGLKLLDKTTAALYPYHPYNK